MKGFLDYLPGNSVLHRIHPLIKILVSMLICAASFCSSNYYYLIGIIVVNILMGAIGNSSKNPTGIKEHNGLLKRTLGILKGLFKMSVFLFILQILAIRNGNAILTLGKFFITDIAVQKALLLVLRLMGATLPLSILISVTNLSDLSNTMVKYLHIPYKYAFTFTSAIRFIPVSRRAQGLTDVLRNSTRNTAWQTKEEVLRAEAYTSALFFRCFKSYIAVSG